MMEHGIDEKPAFRVMGVSRMFSYGSADADIPEYRDEILGRAAQEPVKGMYGICSDEEMAGDRFRYMIAVDLVEEEAARKKLEQYEIPAHTWAVFPCHGTMPLPLQEVNRRIFSEWLPASRYEVAEGFHIEYYSDPAFHRLVLENAVIDSESSE